LGSTLSGPTHDITKIVRGLLTPYNSLSDGAVLYEFGAGSQVLQKQKSAPPQPFSNQSSSVEIGKQTNVLW